MWDPRDAPSRDTRDANVGAAALLVHTRDTEWASPCCYCFLGANRARGLEDKAGVEGIRTLHRS